MAAVTAGPRSMVSATAAHADAELVGRVLSGERDAYTGLVRRYQQPLYRYLRGMGLDHDAGLDLAQDAFVKAYTRLTDCREPAHFRAWLFRIGRNLCLDHLKNVRRRTVPLSSVPSAEEVPCGHGARPELKVVLREALESLSPPLREAFLLKHDAGYTYEEVAEIADATPSAVKMRVHRAREMLRSFLADRRSAGTNRVTIGGAPVVLEDEGSEADRRAENPGAGAARLTKEES